MIVPRVTEPFTAPAVPRVAVIVDLVDSKRVVDRRAVQEEVLRAFALADKHVNVGEPLRATVGDEFQAVYPTLVAALEVTLLARLMLPEGVDCRFGMGRGEIVDVGDGVGGVIQDGSGWWLARNAIDEAHRREDSRTPSLRGWFRAEGDSSALEALVNSYLLSRDHIAGAMTQRARRLTVGTMLGRLQGELADEEGISQSAVSQALRRSGGGSLAAAMDELGRVEL